MTDGPEITKYQDLQSILRGVSPPASNPSNIQPHIKKTRRGSLKGLVSLFAVSVLTFFGAYLNSTSLDTRSSAAGESMYLFLFPNEVTSRKEEIFSLFPKASGPDGKRIGSVTLALKFDPTVFRFESVDPDNAEKNMKALKTTDVTEANAKGLLKVFYGAADGEKAPLKVCDLPKITFRRQGGTAGSSEISMVKDESGASLMSGEGAEPLTGSGVNVIFQ